MSTIPPPPVLAVFNHKGGVAKTTTACNLAVCLAAHGLRTLLVDLDAQGNATGSFGHLPLPPVGAHDVLTDNAGLADSILHAGIPGLSLLPATVALRGAELELGALVRPRTRLADALAAGAAGALWDVVVIDCPPAFGLVTVNALTAASAVLIPARPDAFSHEGLVNTWYEIKRIREADNADLGIAGILLVMTGDDVTGQDAARAIRAEFGPPVLQATIPSTPTVTEAAALSIPIAVLEPDGIAGAAYFQATREVIDRLNAQARARTSLSVSRGHDEALNTLRDWRAARTSMRRLPGGPGWTTAANSAPVTPDAPPPPRPLPWLPFMLGLATGALSVLGAMWIG